MVIKIIIYLYLLLSSNILFFIAKLSKCLDKNKLQIYL